MDFFLDKLIGSPSASASLISALIAASVAIIVVCINQSFSRRQQRVQYLTPKLEELYLLVNSVSESNARSFKLLISCLHGDIEAKSKLDNLDELELYGHLTAKKIIMLVRLYFPQLSKIHQNVFSSQRKLNHLTWLLTNNEPPEVDELINISGEVGHMLRLMEQEIIDNKNKLLRSKLINFPYKRTSQHQLSEVPLPPEAPPFRKSSKI